jgi:regulator of sirC expression with transglutaminase-like and TPR domain
VERILLLRPTSPLEIRDRGIILHHLGRADEALDQLEAYLAFVPEAADADRVEALVKSIRTSGRDASTSGG